MGKVKITMGTRSRVLFILRIFSIRIDRDSPQLVIVAITEPLPQLIFYKISYQK